jgi:phosphoribosylanthranilate isomerase
LLAMAPLRIKICGVTTEADCCQAGLLGADAIGLNFYAPSPRCVSLETAGRILRALPPLVDTVGVFVNQPFTELLPILHHLGRLGTIQWYGNHPELGDTSPFPLIAAFRVRDADSLAEINRDLDACAVAGWLPAAVLIDGHVTGEFGGTGRPAPWALLAEFRPRVPLILAGGLTPENVAEAIRIVRPYAVDVASGVEQSPGRKDREKMVRFIGNAREAAAKLSAER